MSAALTNFVAYLPSPTSRPRLGHLDFSINCITPLSFPSGAYLTSLNQVIDAGRDAHFIPSSRFNAPIPLSSVTLLPPLSGRDILAVGKNYLEHAKEFNSSGYDSSDKADIPTHPIIFTKRASSIIASGERIYPHLGWTEMLDYEGEIAVILGKEGFKIEENDAWDYVWGFTIINDITARDRQRDHKQFFLGKSADTFCPMGPIAVPLTSLPDHKSLRLVTKVNNEVRQDSCLTELIFSVPTLVASISSALTVQPGDVIATGTPAGVGIGRKPPIFLKPGDTIAISVPGLGTLTNTIASANPYPASISHLSDPVLAEKGLIRLATSGKFVHIERRGNLSSSRVVIFIHGLGGSINFYRPSIDVLMGRITSLRDRQLLIYDLEGHGLSPTTPESVVSLASYTADLRDLISTLGLEQSLTTFVAHSLGCLIAMNYYAELTSKALVEGMVLACPPPAPFSVEEVTKLYKRAEAARERGMLSIVDALLAESMTANFDLNDPLAVGYARTILESTDPEGYAKGCTVWATAHLRSDVYTRALYLHILTASRDAVLPRSEPRVIAGRLVWELDEGGHWWVLEKYEAFADKLGSILSLYVQG